MSELNFSSQDQALEWLKRIPAWDAKRGVFILTGRHQSGKTFVVRRLLKEMQATYLNTNLALLETAFPKADEALLEELGKPVSAPYVASKLAKAFRSVAEAQEAPLVIFDHLELLLEYKAAFEPQAFLGDLAAATRRKFILVAPGYERDGVIYLQGKDKFGWRTSEGQFLGQWCQILGGQA